MDTPVILIANHTSYLDPLALAASLPSSSQLIPVRFLAKKEIYDAGLSPFLSLTGTIFLDTNKPLKALKTALAVLKEGNSIGIFPEGTRSITGELLPFKEGVDFLAKKSGAPVLPAVILGTFKHGEGYVNGLKKILLFLSFRYRIKVVFAKPITGEIESEFTKLYCAVLAVHENNKHNAGTKIGPRAS
jgi:1-acyl-sn-glycerol-3-phosphate acyltransferase